MSSAATSVRHKWITLMVQYLISAEIHDTGVCEVVKKTELQVFTVLISSLLKHSKKCLKPTKWIVRALLMIISIIYEHLK